MQLVPHPRDQDLVTIDRRAKATGLPTRTFQPDSCHRVSIPSQWIVVRNAWLRAGWRKCLIICGLRTGWEAGSPCRDPMKPLETLAVLHNVFGTSDLPSLGRFGCFRPFAPVFAFCWRNDTQNDSRCEVLRYEQIFPALQAMIRRGQSASSSPGRLR